MVTGKISSPSHSSRLLGTTRRGTGTSRHEVRKPARSKATFVQSAACWIPDGLQKWLSMFTPSIADSVRLDRERGGLNGRLSPLVRAKGERDGKTRANSFPYDAIIQRRNSLQPDGSNARGNFFCHTG